VEAASAIISVKCSFTTFIPKPHTPFQWESFPSEEYIAGQRDRLFRRFHRNRFVKLSFHPYHMSKVEALLCRGGRELSPVIKEVWKAGATLENWNEHFLIQRWTDALETAGIHFSSALGKRSLDSVLPWDHISSGKSKEELAAIRDRFIAFSNMVK